jgi:hypothetical protein
MQYDSRRFGYGRRRTNTRTSTRTERLSQLHKHQEQWYHHPAPPGTPAEHQHPSGSTESPTRPPPASRGSGGRIWPSCRLASPYPYPYLSCLSHPGGRDVRWKRRVWRWRLKWKGRRRRCGDGEKCETEVRVPSSELNISLDLRHRCWVLALTMARAEHRHIYRAQALVLVFKDQVKKQAQSRWQPQLLKTVVNYPLLAGSMFSLAPGRRRRVVELERADRRPVPSCPVGT